jgi:hypothetical protein
MSWKKAYLERNSNVLSFIIHTSGWIGWEIFLTMSDESLHSLQTKIIERL